ncbi:MAG TPA: hypothetical protein VEQ85_00405 [Lacipirellulaceae bacterium]|nr:hypothetical protein [Lacipirellulaceae bacterium]
MLIPFIGIALEAGLAWYRRAAIIDDLKRRPRLLDDLGLSLSEISAALRETDRARLLAVRDVPREVASHPEQERVEHRLGARS